MWKVPSHSQVAPGDKYVSLMGAAVPQHCLRAGLFDAIQVHLAPVLIGGGVSLSIILEPEISNWSPYGLSKSQQGIPLPIPETRHSDQPIGRGGRDWTCRRPKS